MATRNGPGHLTRAVLTALLALYSLLNFILFILAAVSAHFVHHGKHKEYQDTLTKTFTNDILRRDLDDDTETSSFLDFFSEDSYDEHGDKEYDHDEETHKKIFGHLFRFGPTYIFILLVIVALFVWITTSIMLFNCLVRGRNLGSGFARYVFLGAALTVLTYLPILCLIWWHGSGIEWFTDRVWYHPYTINATLVMTNVVFLLGVLLTLIAAVAGPLSLQSSPPSGTTTPTTTTATSTPGTTTLGFPTRSTSDAFVH